MNLNCNCLPYPRNIVVSNIKKAVSVQEFGGVPDFDPATGEGTDNHLAIQAAIYHCAEQGIKLVVDGGNYRVHNNGSKRKSVDQNVFWYGQFWGGLDIPNNLVMEWDDDSMFWPTAPAYAGAFMSNMNRPIMMEGNWPAVIDWSLDNAVLINPRIDGRFNPCFGRSLAEEWRDRVNDNAIGFGGHLRADGTTYAMASNIQILGGLIRHFPAVTGMGGKGIGAERGVENFYVSGTVIEDCAYAVSFMQEPYSDTKVGRFLIAENIKVKRCGNMFFYTCIDETSKGALDNVETNSAYFSGTGWCVGHFPDMSDLLSTRYRRHSKSAPIVVTAGGPCTIRATIFNPDDYPSVKNQGGGTHFPTGYPTLHINPAVGTDEYYESHMRGAGLSGPIGSVLAGYGNGLDVEINYVGLCDDLWNTVGVWGNNSIKPINAHNNKITITAPKGVRQNIFRPDIGGTGVTLADISPDRKSFTMVFAIPNNAPDRDTDFLGDMLFINGTSYRCVGYNASTKLATIETPLTSSVTNGMAVVYSSAWFPNDKEISAKFEAITSGYQKITDFIGVGLNNVLINTRGLTADGTRNWSLATARNVAQGHSSANMFALGKPVSIPDLAVNTLSARTLSGGVDNVILTTSPLTSGGHMTPSVDNTFNLGNSARRWAQVYSNSAAISTSDARMKCDLTDIDDRLLRAWDKIRFKLFRFCDAFEQKGPNARRHAGLIAQDIREVFEDEGLKVADYAFFCHDSWPGSPEKSHLEEIEITPAEYETTTNEQGFTEEVLVKPAITEVKTIVDEPEVPAGEIYSIRYEEALVIEAAYQRWKITQLEERLRVLENRG